MCPDDVLDYYGKWFSVSRTGGGLFQHGHSGVHIANIVCALQHLGYRPSDNDVYTADLAEEVKHFQRDVGNRNADGRVGPGTRRRLVDRILERYTGRFFRENLRPTFPLFFRVFLSYAWSDQQRVERLEQWLRDGSVSVVRDVHDFEAGQDLKKEIVTHIHSSDKVLAVVTPASQGRDWPTFERFVATKIEELRKENCLIYLLLDGTKAPKDDSSRINIIGDGKSLRDIGQMIRQSMEASRDSATRYEYDQSQPL